VVLKVSCTPLEKNHCSYYFDLELVGFFETYSELSEEMAADIINVNGPSTLYGAARELVLLITGRGPFPPVSLPAVSFVDEAPSKKKTGEKAAASNK
jgi:preprotein translocase subunit SecB